MSDCALRSYLALGVVGLLVGCADMPMPWPLNERQVVMRAPSPPQVLSAQSSKNLPPCPQQLIAQAQWLARNMARIRLGYNKLQVVSVLGDPANSETFSLTNGAAVEVLFYHTPETICRQSVRGEGLMPLVFQDDRLLGYGQNYYSQFIVPSLRPMAVPLPSAMNINGSGGLPQGRVPMYEASTLAPAPARTGRLVQEDLPKPSMPYGQAYGATPRDSNYVQAPVVARQNGYSGAMNRDIYPVNYYETPARSAVGRGDPL